MQPALTPDIPTPQHALELAFDANADFAARYKQTCSSSLINNGIVPALRESLVLLALDETVSSAGDAQERLRQCCKEIGAKALEVSLKREWGYFDAMVSQ
jgi:hypothetical protein